ncbi:MAG: AMP-binding protein [Proteobacteria bacterium]|nr:AMP-binding protein [Pseudomonadota bacterium]
MGAGTVPAKFLETARKFGDRVALREKEFGIWREITWNEYARDVRWTCMSLVSLGLEKGGCISVLSENNPKWLAADIGCQSAGGITVGIYTTNAPFEVQYILYHSESRVAMVEDEEQLDKVLEVWGECPALDWVVVFDMEGLRHFKNDRVMSWDEFMERGRNTDRENPERYEEMVQSVEPDDVAIFIYTSGTTGMPKAAMLSHRNILWTSDMLVEVWGTSEKDEILSFLPLAHIAERTNSVLGPMTSGCVVSFAENIDTVPEDLREVQPTIYFAVPRFWEKFYTGVYITMKDAIWIARAAFRWAERLGRQVAEYQLGHKPVPTWLRIRHFLADKLVFKNVRRSLGMDRSRLLISGAAPVSPEILKFFHGMGLPLREVYGQTEGCGPTSTHMGDDIVIGTVGKPMPGIDVRIAEDGEILVRGPNVFQGYFKNPDLTSETIVDGWLHSGDVGEFDGQGNLKITDRKKDIIITSGGKNITPQHIENELKFSPYISDAIIIGDRRKYLTALIMLDEETIMKYAQDERIPFTTYKSLTQAPEAVKLIGKEVEEVNKKLARVEQVKKFRLLDIKLTSEDGELTATMKLKRRMINEKYKDLIESMY